MDCVPGESIDEKVGDNHYKGKVGMKFGPMEVKYDADIFYDEVDQEKGKIILSGNGMDTKGNGNGEMKMTMMDVIINGKIAQYGRRLVSTVANQLFKQFVSNFSKKLTEAEASTT